MHIADVKRSGGMSSSFSSSNAILAVNPSGRGLGPNGGCSRTRGFRLLFFFQLLSTGLIRIYYNLLRRAIIIMRIIFFIVRGTYILFPDRISVTKCTTTECPSPVPRLLQSRALIVPIVSGGRDNRIFVSYNVPSEYQYCKGILSSKCIC